MIKIAFLVTALIAAMPLQAASTESPRFAVELESGPVWFSRNKARIPNEGGTRFDLTALTGKGAAPYSRIYGSWQINPRHSLRLNIAPLAVRGNGQLDREVHFQGKDFAADTPTRGYYRFSTYRGSYRWTFHDSERWQWGVGATLLVRDARIRLQQNEVRASDDDLGLVPLAHLQGRYRINARNELILDLEGAAASPGRAVDLALKYRHHLPSGWHIGAGYRTLEGGADNDSLYTFAWLHYAVFSLGYHFN